MQEATYEQSNQERSQSHFLSSCHAIRGNSVFYSEQRTNLFLKKQIPKTSLDPIVAFGSFFNEQKQSLADHVHPRDPFIQHLYSSAKHIFQHQIKVDESLASCLLRVVI
ncbi:hypothetical protein BDF20DRAFT_952912 [Mycotypha africana]|uniref:uncharacterized protein n=1 Tax=Mycotypha africana TaxID=64632 RepID=UPI0023011BDB|nr:uncharacterized protein BDF20DRAFT_952912 [Mycotypha africana]KAI8988093.1 hypothetical protein BDF20DRAFT_952912 [Mycotypha africana]